MDNSPVFFYVIIVLFCLLATAIFTINAINYSTIQRESVEGTTSALLAQSQRATTLIWVNVILAVISFIIFIWAGWKLLTRPTVPVARVPTYAYTQVTTQRSSEDDIVSLCNL